MTSSRLAELPTDVDWYEPTGEVVPVTDYVAVGPTMVRDGKGPGRSP